jgi:hypothetical protein
MPDARDFPGQNKEQVKKALLKIEQLPAFRSKWRSAAPPVHNSSAFAFIRG